MTVVVSFGGGVNSAACVKGLADRGEHVDAIVFADTRGEKRETYDWIAQAFRPWLAKAGLPDLTIVCRADYTEHHRTGDVSLEAECLRQESLPSRAFGFGRCAMKWKIDPINWWFDAQGFDQKAQRIIGYDATPRDRARARASNAREHERNDPRWTLRYPLIEWGWDRDQCAEEWAKTGLSVPPKSSCFYCPSSTKTEILQLRKRSPDEFARAVAMEERARASGQLGSVLGLGRRFSWRVLGDVDERQLSLLPEAPVEPCGVCVDGLEE